jgi:cell division protein YceG involved in septum cleavage
MKKKKRLAKFLAGLLVLVLVGLASTYVLYTNLSKPAAGESDAVLFEIKSGEVLRKVANNLEEQGIVRSAIIVEVIARIGQSGRIEGWGFCC